MAMKHDQKKPRQGWDAQASWLFAAPATAMAFAMELMSHEDFIVSWTDEVVEGGRSRLTVNLWFPDSLINELGFADYQGRERNVAADSVWDAIVDEALDYVCTQRHLEVQETQRQARYVTPDFLLGRVSAAGPAEGHSLDGDLVSFEIDAEIADLLREIELELTAGSDEDADSEGFTLDELLELRKLIEDIDFDDDIE